jgi:DNA repair protein RadC
LAGVTLLAPQESFKNAYLRRNKAAHDADADSPYDDLLNYIKEATAIAFSFDALITKSLYFVSQQDEGYLQNNKNYIKAGNLKIRFIIYNNGQWKRFDILQGEAINSSSDYQELVSSFRTRQTGKDEIIIIKNERNDIIDWELYSL